MNTRLATLGGAAVLLLAIAGGGALWAFQPDAVEPLETTEEIAPGEVLPVPPVPPRIAQGEEYETCLAMLPNDPSGASSYAETWQTRGGGDGAVHCLGLAKIALGDAEAGAQALQQLANTSTGTPAARATVYDQAAQGYLMAGAIDEAYAAGTLALGLSPDDPDLLTDRAVAAGNLGKYQDALDDLTRALELDPRRADALVLRASSWRHLGRLELASDDVARALAIDPENAEALLERGIIRQRRDDVLGARADWKRAMDLAPDSAAADLAEQNLALLEAGPERR